MLKLLQKNSITAILRLILGVVWITSACSIFADEPKLGESAPLAVAVVECPPFVIVENGHYSGLAIYLWEQVGQELGFTWNYTEYPLGSLLNAVHNQKSDHPADVGISCISVTAEREKLIDFSHAFTETHTAIAIRETSLWSSVAGFFSNSRVLTAFFIVFGIAALIGAVFYVLEQKINKKIFSKKSLPGKFVESILVGLLFVTNGPIRFYQFKTLTGRVIATLLALSSTFLIAAITAVLASSFTLNSLQSQVRGLDDLRGMSVGALDGSTSSGFLASNGVIHQTRPDLKTLVTDLDNGSLDAVVSDAAFLQYRINQGKAQGQFDLLSVLPYEYEAQSYAFVLAENSPLRERVNRSLLTVRKQKAWRDKVNEYLGD